MKLNDLIGKTFGRWTVLGKAESVNFRSHLMCICECGTEKPVNKYSLESGRTVSCGCYRAENPNIVIKHGYAQKVSLGKVDPMYYAWQSMIRRCTDAKVKHYPYYGGRGISVCERWYNFEAFVEDMGPRPKNHSLDRIDNNGNYCKDNCRWATYEEQSRNTRRSVHLTYLGKTRHLIDWANETGISAATLRSRINLGWGDDKVLSTPVRGTNDN